MRKLALLVGVVFAVGVLSGTCFAVDRNNVGCGLGSILFEGQNGLIQQVLAATTNGTTGTQTLGISSGTLECKQFGKFVDNKVLNTFVAENMDGLAKDISMGKGENLNTLAILMDIPSDQRPVFYGKLQSNFSRIYTSEKVSHTDVIKNIVAVM